MGSLGERHVQTHLNKFPLSCILDLFDKTIQKLECIEYRGLVKLDNGYLC